MKLSMIVVTTSWAPVNAFRKPGMKPHGTADDHADDDRERDGDDRVPVAYEVRPQRPRQQ